MPQKVQAIAGVSASGESDIRSEYPSIAGTWMGRLVGMLCELIPIKIWGVKISYLLFGPLVAPIAPLIYLFAKLGGERWALTNRTLERRAMFGTRLIQSVSLTEILDITVFQQAGQEFYRASDLYVLNAKRDPIMLLSGVPQADIFRLTVLKVRDARQQVEASLKTIQARQPA